ncbi:Lipoprotein-anchoring transpeptidase ErfK/SrfK [Rhizobium sp. RU35A]|nr:Lipoprotein-anchoring transpeptidase ErfK/SrfK [Rhizobium sp. RU35A]
MKSTLVSSLLIGAFLILQGAASATAQTVYGRPDTILVTPTGEILDYVPEAGEVTVARDRRGRRVLIDHFGNVVATEVPRGAFNGGGDAYTQPPAGAPRGYSQRGYPDQGPAGWNDPRGGYPDYRQYRGNEPGAVTGSIPRDTSVTRLPLDANGAIVDDEQQEASLEQDRVQPLPQPTIQPRNDRPVMAITNKAQAEVVALQVFLDRQGISPGVIDGRLGDNVNKAVAAWQEMTGETLDPNNSEDIMQRLTYSGGLPFTTYTITPADAAGPYVAAIPEDYAHKSQLPAMSYTSVTEALAERFHMDEGYLKALNPGVDFTIPGTIVKVVNPGPPKTGEVVRVVADKAKKQVFAYGADGKLLAAYPATIGSTDTPSPTGTHTVVRVALNPGYTYNPKINFKQGANDKILQIPPGPNGPVGTVWIALSKPTYGIHGTPDPSKIGKTNSHGCIRLTNWDATELAKMVKPGTVVEFVD